MDAISQRVQGDLHSGCTSFSATYAHDARPAVHQDNQEQQNEPNMPKPVTTMEIRVGSVCVCVCARTGQGYGHWILFIDDFI